MFLKNVAGAPWYEVPAFGGTQLKDFPWIMLGKPAPYGCKFRSVLENNHHLQLGFYV